MKHIPFLLLIVLMVFGCKLKSTNTEIKSALISDKKPATKQNILFISIDDLRPLINSYGATKMITPNMDQLAKEGLQFNNAFTNIAVCGASRASIMTGIRPSQKRFRGFNTKASNDTPNAKPIHQLFQENGYETISYGKVFHHANDFKEYWSEIDKGQIQTDFQDPENIKLINNSETGRFGKLTPIIESPEVDDYAYNDGKITKNALSKLKKLKATNKPFFMAVGYVSPHLPFIQPKKYWDLYNHDSIKLADNRYIPKNAPQLVQHNSAELRTNYLNVPKKGLLSEEMSKDLIHGYYASVSYMDALIGELIQGLDALGLRENTSIVLWSDHGFFLGEHSLWCKHSTLQEAVKVPLIISSAKYAKNKTTASFTELVDIYPTLCDLANLEKPNYLQGESLIPVLEDPSKILKTEVYTRYRKGEAVIDKEYSYTEFYRGENYLGNMLFDLNKDPNENIDISKDPSNTKIVSKYKEKLKIMRTKVDKDPFENY